MSAQIYEIKAGDNLTKIAKKFNTSVAKLAELNKIENVDLIFAGASLTLPVDSFESSSQGDKTLNGTTSQEHLTEEEKQAYLSFSNSLNTKVNFTTNSLVSNQKGSKEEEEEEELTVEENQAYRSFANNINTRVNFTVNSLVGNQADIKNEGSIDEYPTSTSQLDLSGYAENIDITQASTVGNIALVGTGATIALATKPYINGIKTDYTTLKTNYTTAQNAKQNLRTANNSLKTAQKNLKKAQNAEKVARKAATKAMKVSKATTEISSASNAVNAAVVATENAEVAVTAAATAQKTASTAAGAASKAVTKAGTKVISKAALPLAVAVEGYALYSAYNEGEEAFKEQSKKTAVVASCTAIGAGVGAWFLGVGAAPGGAVGALVGEVITWFM